MRPAVFASVLLGCAACGEPAIKLHLGLVPDNGFDYSCIGAVDVMPIPVGYNRTYDISEEYNRYDANDNPIPGLPITCIALARPPTSLDDLGRKLHDQLDLPIPQGGLAAVELRARVGNCTRDQVDTYGEAIVYGGGAYGGGDDLTIQLAHNLYCGEGEEQVYTFRPVDLLATASSHACGEAPAGEVDTGNIRPTNIGSTGIFELGASYADVGSGSAGVGSDASVAAYKRSYALSCPAVGFYSLDGIDSTASCINLAAPRLCDPNEIDVPFIAQSYLDSAAGAVTTIGPGYQNPVLVAVYQDQNGQKVPVAGATISAKGDADAKFVFGDNAANAFTPTPAAQKETTSSGLVMAYLHGLDELDVTAGALRGSADVAPAVSQGTSAALIVVK